MCFEDWQQPEKIIVLENDLSLEQRGDFDVELLYCLS